MRQTEIISHYRGTPTHPYVATVTLDPMEAGRFERMADNEPSVCVLGVDRSVADAWTVYAACASEESRHLLELAW